MNGDIQLFTLYASVLLSMSLWLSVQLRLFFLLCFGLVGVSLISYRYVCFCVALSRCCPA